MNKVFLPDKFKKEMKEHIIAYFGWDCKPDDIDLSIKHTDYGFEVENVIFKKDVR